MDRRAFLRRAALVATGAVAADQLDLLERLGWVRRLFPGWTAPRRTAPMCVTQSQWDALLRENYVQASIVEAINVATPFRSQLRLRDARGKPWVVPLRG